ncbi:MAG: hypothetical protein U0Q03_14895 [Acidimicrobiales bacterium]
MAAAPPSRRASLMCGALLALAAAGGLVACSDDAAPTVAGYCERVTADLEALGAPSIVTGADVQPVIDRYTAIADAAPAAIEPEWRTAIAALQAADAVVPGDQASIDEATRAALAGQPAYTRIQQYTQAECGLALGTPPTPTNPVTATTVAPTTTGG